MGRTSSPEERFLPEPRRHCTLPPPHDVSSHDSSPNGPAASPVPEYPLSRQATNLQ